MKNELIAKTELVADPDGLPVIDYMAIDDEASGGETLVEFAGRGCYLSWDKPNPETARARDYVRKNIIGKGHESVLEHVSVSFYVSGVSRALGYELLRHRHLSRSELSQRYVPMHQAKMVVPPLIREGMRIVNPDLSAEELDEVYQDQELWNDARIGYREIIEELEEVFPDAKPKEIREAARAAMPNATETAFTVTGNLRCWRHVLKMRGALDADAEIREWAVDIFIQLKREYPSVFVDMAIGVDESGRLHILELPNG